VRSVLPAVMPTVAERNKTKKAEQCQALDMASSC